MALSGVRELLVERDFRLLLGSQFIAQAADGLAQAAYTYVLVLEPEGTPSRMLAVFALTLLPYSAISPFLGVFVDRWSRRSVMVWSNAIRAALLVTFPLWEPTGDNDLPLYAAALSLMGLGRLFLTTKGASLPTLVHEHHLLTANSVSGGGGFVFALIGGVTGLGIVRYSNPEVAFVAAGIGYVAAAVIARRISTPLSHPHARIEKISEGVVRIAAELKEGLVEITRTRRASLALLAIFILRTMIMIVTVSAIVVIKEKFPGSENELSPSAIALGVAGAGAAVGAVLAPRVGGRVGNAGLIVLGFAVTGAGVVGLGGVTDFKAVLGIALLAGFGGFVGKVAVDAQVQEALHDEYRGRAFALYDILYNVASVVAAGVMVTLESIDMRVLLLACGVLTLALGGLIAGAMRRAGMFPPLQPAEST